MPSISAGARLRELRDQRGLTQPEAAEALVLLARKSGDREISVNAAMISTWERDCKQPRRYYRRLLASLFQVPEKELGFGVASASARSAEVAIFTGSPPATLASSRVDETTIGQLFEMRAALSCSDALAGPTLLITCAVEQVTKVEQLLPHAPRELRCSLFGIGAMFAEFVGWLFDDAGNPIAGRVWSARAFEWSHASENPELVSYVLMRRAQQATLVGDAGLTIALAKAAQRNPEEIGSRVMAAAAQQQAHGHALDGDEPAALAALERAAEIINARESGKVSHLARFCTLPYIDAQRGACLVTLGRPKTALIALDAALAAWPATYRRERGLHLARKAVALAQVAEPAHAAAIASESLSVVRATGSVRTFAELIKVKTLLAGMNTNEVSVASFQRDFAQYQPLVLS